MFFYGGSHARGKIRGVAPPLRVWPPTLQTAGNRVPDYLPPNNIVMHAGMHETMPPGEGPVAEAIILLPDLP
ncbi:MAG TPA: hypothetical protein ENH54_01165 [Actinobacteria bacterium]|nr:hypothetical protein [Actinomycetota bacterium]